MKQCFATSNFRHLPALAFLFLAIPACAPEKPEADASGFFEAEETIVPAEGTGVLRMLNLEEGQALDSGQLVGYIDTTLLHLQKKQLLAQIKAIGSRVPDVGAQTAFYQEQLKVLEVRLDNLRKEQKRTEQLAQANAATPKQLDDLQAAIAEITEQMDVVRQQRQAQVAALSTQRAGLQNDPLPLQVQIEQLEEQLRKHQLTNPVKGTVLAKYLQAHEMAIPGKPIYKIADLSSLFLRAYISGSQLPQVKIGQQVSVRSDDGSQGFRETRGQVTWISDKAEFTPKTILTKAERANQVYALKIKVDNPDGIYKPGMFAEIKF